MNICFSIPANTNFGVGILLFCFFLYFFDMLEFFFLQQLYFLGNYLSAHSRRTESMTDADKQIILFYILYIITLHVTTKVTEHLAQKYNFAKILL